jgi:hypothetical protein
MWIESPWGKVRCMCRHSQSVEPGTVLTWNAIGKSAGAWNLLPSANESQLGFLLNHVISEELPVKTGGTTSNSDPITGQAAWFDVRVRIYPAEAGEPSRPRRSSNHNPTRHQPYFGKWLAYFAGGKNQKWKTK